MIEITLTGRMGKEEVDVQFDEQTRQPVSLSIRRDSLIPDEYKAWYDRTWSADLHGFEPLIWTLGLNSAFIHPDKPAVALLWLRKQGFQTTTDEEDWIECEN